MVEPQRCCRVALLTHRCSERQPEPPYMVGCVQTATKESMMSMTSLKAVQIVHSTEAADPAAVFIPDPALKVGNPAVVGLAGFGMTTLLLQFHNIGMIGIGPIIWLGLIFGGAAQFIAGLQEIRTGNNFGYSAFTAYGCFWISLALMQIGNATGLFKVT